MSPEQELEKLKELAKNYEFGPMWREDADSASAHFKVVFKEVADSGAYVEAQAGTGTRYAVYVWKMAPRVQQLQGATHCVSVIHPWNRSVLLNLDLTRSLRLTYLRDKIEHDGLVHGGDLTGLALAIAEGWKLLQEKAGKNRALSVVW